jgi:hypothetical protein
MMVLSLLINYVRIYMQEEKALPNTIRGIVILHTPYHVLGNVQVEIIEIAHVEDMDHNGTENHRQPHCSNATYGQSVYQTLDPRGESTYWRAIGLVHILDSILRVRYIANTRGELLLDNNVWEEEGYLEGWSKWVRICRWYYRPIMDVVKALCKGSIM